MPKIKLTDSTKKFIDTLGCEDISKITFTEDAFEYKDKSISDKLAEYRIARLMAIGSDIRAFNEELCREHPEYFE